MVEKKETPAPADDPSADEEASRLDRILNSPSWLESLDSSAPPLDDGIGSRIRQARESRGWTQLVLSNRTKLVDPSGKGVSRTVVVGYEAGTHRPGAREMQLLCRTLKATPNWLLFGQENPFEALQPSMDIVRARREIESAIRLAFTILLLRPHERDTLASLALSLGGREVGDLRLSGLSSVATWATKPVIEFLRGYFDDDVNFDLMTAREVVERASRSFESNLGNDLTLDEESGKWQGSWVYPDPGPKTNGKT